MKLCVSYNAIDMTALRHLPVFNDIFMAKNMNIHEPNQSKIDSF